MNFNKPSLDVIINLFKKLTKNETDNLNLNLADIRDNTYCDKITSQQTGKEDKNERQHRKQTTKLP